MGEEYKRLDNRAAHLKVIFYYANMFTNQLFLLGFEEYYWYFLNISYGGETTL